ncbi:histidine kinase [Streptomyces sp. RY43-2]|uniref:histidine kinase n=1 Tax=Streptomyces macrolidinus TaxID=2952607 RepID=A0ABT0Z8Q4_9ACTN|nr:histidine kinase [Streptomyces macrolidinus]MCN9240138.1 histidine kinase [Streptomyces macrolidinus]
MAASLPRPHRDDVLIAAGGLLGGLFLVSVGLHSRTRHDPVSVLDQDWATLIPLLVTTGCELLRRTRPRPALVIGTLAIVMDLFTRGNLATVVMFTDLVYAAVVYGSAASARRLPWTMGALTVLGSVVPFAIWRVPEALLIGVAIGAVTLVPASTGWVVRNHRVAADAERLRAEQTALLAEMDRTQAVTAERARMARELHDMVANHLSAIAIHSTAALSIGDPKTSQDALTVIRENSVEGLAEMRRLIGILREGPAESEPAATPTLDGLGTLVDSARTNGLDVTLDTAYDSVPAPVELAAYRIVQESLTNALKHACAGRVTVRLVQRDDALEVRVTSPYGERGGPRAPGSGAGLVGMRERAALLGGDFEAGPEGALWTVRAVLPLNDVGEARRVRTTQAVHATQAARDGRQDARQGEPA